MANRLIHWVKNIQAEYWFLFVVVLIFIAFKYPDLHQPCFWDEAWAYYPTIYKMIETTPVLFPNDVIVPDLYRGHPLLFYFMAAFWSKLFGNSLWVTKLFALAIAVLYLVSLFVFAKKHFNRKTALLSVLFLVVQSVFFVQSTLLLLEILLALFSLWALYFYIERKIGLTIIFLTLALYTKETAVVLWASLFLFEVYKVFINSSLQNAVRLSMWFLPLMLSFIFYGIQYLKAGWFFFPEHIAFINVDSFIDKLSGYAAYIFIYHGRNLITFSAIIAMLMFRKNIPGITYPVVLILVFSFFFLVFSSFNFYSPRYILSILPLVLMVALFYLFESLKKLPVIVTYTVFTVLFAHNLYVFIFKGNGNDHTLGYRDQIEVEKTIIRYCENNQLYNDSLFTPFLLTHYLTMPELGYLTSSKTFICVSHKPKTGYALFSSAEYDPTIYDSIKSEHTLLMRVEKNKSWAEVYRIGSE